MGACIRVFKSITEIQHLFVAIFEYFLVYVLLEGASAWYSRYSPNKQISIEFTGMQYFYWILKSIILIAFIVEILVIIKDTLKNNEVSFKNAIKPLIRMVFAVIAVIVINLAYDTFPSICRMISLYEINVYDFLLNRKLNTLNEYIFVIFGLYVFPACKFAILIYANKHLEQLFPINDNRYKWKSDINYQ